MERCEYYEEKTKIIGWLGPDEVIKKEISVCNGTKEQDACSCGGNPEKCTFYQQVKETALKEQVMKAKLIINGKELEVEITEEELKKLEAKPENKTGYERVKDGNTFWFDVDGTVGSDVDLRGDSERDNAYEVANYYSDFDVAMNNARADKLMRQLRRFAVEHRTLPMLWGKSCTIDYAYYIFYDYENEKLEWMDTLYNCRDFGKIYFDSMEATELAIEAFRDELLWYFTEYEDSL